MKRNVMGAVNAMSCADMALAGLEGGIPCDEVIDAMAAVGRAMPPSLRETGEVVAWRPPPPGGRSRRDTEHPSRREQARHDNTEASESLRAARETYA